MMMMMMMMMMNRTRVVVVISRLSGCTDTSGSSTELSAPAGKTEDGDHHASECPR